MNDSANIAGTVYEQTVKLIRAAGKGYANAMDTARSYMQSEPMILSAQNAMNTLSSEYAKLPKDKRPESTIKAGIRAFYKNMSTAVSLERAKLSKAGKSDDDVNAELCRIFPFRVLCIKGCYQFMTHADFMAETANRRTPTDGAGDGDATEEGDTDGTEKGIDKAAAAIHALELALAEMTADRDAWKARAVLAEACIDDAKRPVRAAKKRTSAKKAA